MTKHVNSLYNIYYFAELIVY